MVNNRTGPWKRPALHQRREQAHHHSPPPEHPLIPRDECPAKRRRDLGPDQVNVFDLETQPVFHFLNAKCVKCHC